MVMAFFWPSKCFAESDLIPAAEPPPLRIPPPPLR